MDNLCEKPYLDSKNKGSDKGFSHLLWYEKDQFLLPPHKQLMNTQALKYKESFWPTGQKHIYMLLGLVNILYPLPLYTKIWCKGKANQASQFKSGSKLLQKFLLISDDKPNTNSEIWPKTLLMKAILMRILGLIKRVQEITSIEPKNKGLWRRVFNGLKEPIKESFAGIFVDFDIPRVMSKAHVKRLPWKI